MDEQRKAGHEVVFRRWATIWELRAADEVWIHCGWMPCLWWANLWAKKAVRMPEACYDPVRLKYHGWKKWLVGPIERWALRRCKRIVATCEEEKRWIEEYLGTDCPEIEVADIKRFFKIPESVKFPEKSGMQAINVLYLGRRHPLKGTEYLEQAVAELNRYCRDKVPGCNVDCIELREVSNAHGKELEKAWDWADVLCLPTLSDNFALVVAEALERGKPVITTDGAPSWKDMPERQGFYLRGYRDGSEEMRVKLLKDALMYMVD